MGPQRDQDRFVRHKHQSPNARECVGALTKSPYTPRQQGVDTERQFIPLACHRVKKEAQMQTLKEIEKEIERHNKVLESASTSEICDVLVRAMLLRRIRAAEKEWEEYDRDREM